MQINFTRKWKMKTKIEGEVTAETILSQCIRMSNDNIWAFFEYNPHLEPDNRVCVSVKPGDIDADNIYNTWDDLNKSLADIMSDLIKIQYEQEQENE